MLEANRIACFFSTSGHSGVDRAARHLIPALARRGYRVDLLKVRGHGPELETLPEGVALIDLGARQTLACLPAVVRYLRCQQPAAMLSDKDKVNRVALLARALARVPTRLTLRSGTTISRDLATRGMLERGIQRHSMRWLYPFAEQVIVASAGVADDMADYTGLARARICVVPPPVVPAALFAAALPRPAHPWFGQPGVPLILSAGELCGRKDFATLLRAFAQVRAVRPCRLMILGKGSARARLLALATELGVRDAVALPGYVANAYDYMAHADLFAFTSRWEGLGFVLIEALAVGTPVVSVDCPSGPREILDAGRYGPLVPVGDADALARAMLETLACPLPRQVLQQAARPYEIESSTDAYLTAMGLRCTATPPIAASAKRG